MATKNGFGKRENMVTVQRNDSKVKTKVIKQPQLKNRLDTQVETFWGYLFDNEGCDYDYFRKIRKMLIKDNATSLAYDSLCTLIVNMIEEYTHDDADIQNFIRSNLEILDGTIDDIWLDACTMFLYGFSIAEWSIKFDESGKAILDKIHFLRQDLIDFGDDSPIEKITYQSNIPISLDYDLCLHFINQKNITPGINPKGHRLADRALDYWDLDRIMLAAYAVVAQKQATKLMVGKTDTSAKIETGLIAVDGSELLLENSDVMLEALQNAANSSVLVIDKDDDIVVVDQRDDGKFFLDGFHYTAEERFRAFYHGLTMFSTSKSGVGDAGLAEFQQQNVLSIVSSKAKYLSSIFVEKLIKKIIIFNFGEQEKYGAFTINLQDPKALEIAKVVSGIVGQIGTDAQRKLAFDRMFDLVGIASLEEFRGELAEKNTPGTQTDTGGDSATNVN